MPQDQISGAKANAEGHARAQKVAKHIGATMINPGISNEATWSGKNICIKSARQGNTLIGVTSAMLGHIGSVVAALQEPNGKYSIFEVSSTWFNSQMRTPAKWPNIGFVQCAKIRNSGKMIGSGVTL